MTAWTEWLTRSFFRIRASPAAVEKLHDLPPDVQARLRRMLHDITELVDLTPANTGQMWVAGATPAMFNLRVGRVQVRYTISVDTRSLTIQDVVPLEGEEPLGRTG